MKKIRERRILYSKDIPKYDTVLGFDCSSSTIGWGVVSIDDKVQLLAHGHFKPPGIENFELMRLQHTWMYIVNLCNLFKPKYVSIEDIFLFMSGKSSARTITVLTAFNRTVGLAAYQTTGSVSLYSVHEVRNIIKNYYNIKNTIQKNEIPEIIRNYLSPRFLDIINKKGNITSETYDEADAIAVSWAKVLHIMNPSIIDTLIKQKLKRKREK